MDIFSTDNIINTYRNDIEELKNFRHSAVNRKRKVYNIRANPMEDLNDKQFKIRYRFSKENMKKIINILRNDLCVDIRGGSIPVELQVMAVMRYWGRHEIQEDCACIHGMSQQTLSRLCRKVAIALASKSSVYIKMPSNIREEHKTMQNFFSVCELPHIIGVIDGTHIKIKKVGGDAGQYYMNQEGQYSINTQVICNADLEICDIVCHWGGSTHNAKIFCESSIKRRFEENEFKGKLLGESAYPCTSFLLTPVLRPMTEMELNYNYKHIRAHNIIDRCFDVLKQRFRILLEVMRGSYCTIKTTIIACAVLHNLAIEFKDSLTDYDSTRKQEDEYIEDISTA